MDLPHALQSQRYNAGARLEDLPADLELTTQQAAPYLEIRASTLDKWRRLRRGPIYHAYGDGPRPRIRYRVGDLLTFRANYGKRVDPSEGTDTPARVA